MTLHDWIIYAVVISAVLALTGWSLDGLLRALGRPSRLIWLATLTLSVVVPSGTLFLNSSSSAISPAATQAQEAAAESKPRAVVAASVVRTVGVVHGEAQVWLAQGVVRGGEVLSALSREGASIRRAWAAASLTLTLLIAIGFGRLWFDARSWRKAFVQGRQIWIARAIGPASVGLFRPRVVLPEWATGLEPKELALVLAHEEEHARVRDPLLLGLAWIPVVAMPWNPFLWWQYRRLGSAVEVDCDRRVLGRGANRRNYLALLVRLAARTQGDGALLPSVARFASPLKTRMEAMIDRRRATAHPGFLLMVIVGLSLVVVACGPMVPEMIRESSAPPQYDPIRVFRNSQQLVLRDLATLPAPRELVVQERPREEVAQDRTPLALLSPPQDTANARPCEYWRVNPDGTTRTGPGLVVNARCVPREDAGRPAGIGTIGPAPEDSPPCVYWVPNADSLVTRPGVIWNGQCGPRERWAFIRIAP